MSFEVPGWIVLTAIVGFASTQAVLMSFARWAYVELSDMKRTMGYVSGRLDNGITERLDSANKRLGRIEKRLDDGDAIIHEHEIRCARNHAGI